MPPGMWYPASRKAHGTSLWQQPLQRRGVDELPAAPAAMVVAGSGNHQAEVLGDSLGWLVVGVDDRDQAVDLQDVVGVVPAGCRGFGGQAAALEASANVVADLDLGHTIDLLRGQAAVADELTGVPQ